MGLLQQRVTENRKVFFVYRDADSAFNHGFPSGFFGALNKIALDANCVDDPATATGCASDRNRLDRERGNVLRISFAPAASRTCGDDLGDLRGGRAQSPVVIEDARCLSFPPASCAALHRSGVPHLLLARRYGRT